MTDEEKVSQALAELWDIVKCRCHEAYTGRGLHDPDCQCDSTDALQTVADRIEALTAERERWKDACRSASRDLNIVVPDNDRLKSERDAAEAKLAKAVRLIDMAVELARWDLNPKLRDDMIDFTTEIKGERHEALPVLR